jgi:hypothetical protein
MFPKEKLAYAIGPNAKYPELQREHEIEGARIAREILERLAVPNVGIGRVVEIIDGHDTRKHALSLEDALMKDADKLWRFTAHGIATISGWWGHSAKETLAMLEPFVLPSVLTDAGRAIADGFVAERSASTWLQDLMQLSETDLQII